MILADSPPAIPLWINGHAFLTMAPAFRNVCNPVNGQVLRRTPLCGASEAVAAVAAAQAALVSWRQLAEADRADLFAALAASLSGLADHFAGLIAEETGKDLADAQTEVVAAVAMLQQSSPSNVSDVIGVIGDARLPLLSVLNQAIPDLMAGAVLVIKPDPSAPSAIYALAELTARCGFPPGVFNILHGDDVALAGLRNALGG